MEIFAFESWRNWIEAYLKIENMQVQEQSWIGFTSILDRLTALLQFANSGGQKSEAEDGPTWLRVTACE